MNNGYNKMKKMILPLVIDIRANKTPKPIKNLKSVLFLPSRMKDIVPNTIHVNNKSGETFDSPLNVPINKYKIAAVKEKNHLR